MDGKKHNYKSKGKQKSADMTKSVSGFGPASSMNKRAASNKGQKSRKKTMDYTQKVADKTSAVNKRAAKNKTASKKKK